MTVLVSVKDENPHWPSAKHRLVLTVSIAQGFFHGMEWYRIASVLIAGRPRRFVNIGKLTSVRLVCTNIIQAVDYENIM